MNTWAKLTALLFAICGNSAAFAQQRDIGQPVSVVNLIATPQKFHRKVVFITAWARVQFEDMSVCLSRDALSGKDCLWLEIWDGEIKTDADAQRYRDREKLWRQFDNQVISLRGTFDAENTGHLGGRSGAIEKVSEVYGPDLYVDFTSNPPLQRRRGRTPR